jgi:hypothetical protein
MFDVINFCFLKYSSFIQFSIQSQNEVLLYIRRPLKVLRRPTLLAVIIRERILPNTMKQITQPLTFLFFFLYPSLPTYQYANRNGNSRAGRDT